MANVQGHHSLNDKKAYKRALMASQYLACDEVTSTGSASNVNANLVAVARQNPWPVSRMGEHVQKIPIRDARYSGWIVHVIDNTASGTGAVPVPVLTTKDKLDHIRAAFGLSISHLSKVLMTTRPTLHSWLDGEVEPRDQSVNRIDRIYQISQAWKQKCSFHYSPDRLMRQPLGAGSSMLARLERERLDDAEINEGLDRLLELVQRQRKQMDLAKQRTEKEALSAAEQENTRHFLTPTVYSE